MPLSVQRQQLQLQRCLLIPVLSSQWSNFLPIETIALCPAAARCTSITTPDIGGMAAVLAARGRLARNQVHAMYSHYSGRSSIHVLPAWEVAVVQRHAAVHVQGRGHDYLQCGRSCFACSRMCKAPACESSSASCRKMMLPPSPQLQQATLCSEIFVQRNSDGHNSHRRSSIEQAAAQFHRKNTQSGTTKEMPANQRN